MKDTYEFDIDERLRPYVERKLTGTTKTDSEIASLDLTGLSVVAKGLVILLRTYRKITPASIRNRCVFEPSCSHYCEGSIRKHGVTKGCLETIKRLSRCQPGNGGTDLP